MLRRSRALALAAALPALAAAAAAAQELPFLEHARVDPRKVVTAEKCGECHTAELEVWQKTPHATGFRTLHRRERALDIAGKLGFRLIKRDSICFSCHYTPVVERGRIRVDSGVSCESCHGAGADWIDLHNAYGEDRDHRSESAEHRRQRIEASRRAGMRRPSDLYPVVANCFSCHTVPNEELVNVAGHSTGSAGFEFVEWSQGELRHNFLDASLAGGPPVNAQRPMGRKRLMYVTGRALDLEYSLRGVAAASQDGVYTKAMIRRVRSALSELRAIQAAADIAQVAEMVAVVRGVDVVPRNRAALEAAAERVGAATRAFLAAAEPARLAALDDLVLGRQPATELVAEAAPAPAAGEPATGEPSAAPAAGPGAPKSAAAPGGAGGAAAAGRAAPAAAPAAAAGPMRRRLRPASQHRTLGPGACSGCHGPQNQWWFGHAHYRSADPFFDGDPDTVRIATLYGISPSQITRGGSLCMDCHGTVVSGKEARDVLDGVSCESCHGAAADWLEPHKNERDKQLGRSRPGYRAALANGKADLGDLALRARTCSGCHYVTDPRLLSAGHPSGAEFDYVRGMAEVRHWQATAAPGELRTAFAAALAGRGPVPQVERAVLAAGGGQTEPTVRRRRAAASSSPGGRPAVLALAPPPPRPARAGGSSPAAAAARRELPELPGISGSLTLEELLAALQRRIAELYRLTSQPPGSGR